MAKSAQQITQKFRDRVAGAGAQYTQGVQNPKADWLTNYVRAQPRMQAGLQAAIAAKKPERMAAAKGGTANWQEKAASKGSRNYTAAADDAAKGYSAVADKVLAAGENARRAAEGLPNTTIDQRIQRAVAAMKAVSDSWKTR